MPEPPQSLIVDLAGRRYGVPAAWVVRVGYAGAVSAVPFARAPVEGVAMLDGAPVTQIDTAAALGLPRGDGGKLVVIGLERGRLALRVDGIVGVSRAAPEVPALPMDLVLRSFSGDAPAPAAIPAGATSAGETVDLLLALVAGEAVALFAAGVDRVVEIEAVRTLDTGDGVAVDVAIVDGQPVAVASLGSCRAGNPAAGRWGVIGRGEAAAVLLVDRVLDLRRVPLWRLGRAPGASGPMLCVSLDDGRVMPVHDLAGPAGAGPVPMPAGIGRTRPVSARAGQRASGLRVRCAGIDVVVPLAMIVRIGSRDDLRPAAARAVPVFDGARLLGAGAGTGSAVVVTAGGGRFRAILVDRAELDGAAGAPPWVPTPWLPDGAAALFDAVRPDPVTGAWVLRLRADPAPPPWTVRRALVAARRGWAAFDQGAPTPRARAPAVPR